MKEENEMVEIELAGEGQKELLRNFFNVYQGELSQYSKDFQAMDQNGYFDYSTVDEYFTGDEAILPYLIKKNHQFIGFCILTTAPYVKSGCDYCIQEFYIIGYHRGKGIAMEACNCIMKRYQGTYCLLVLAANKRAFAFWKKVAQSQDDNVRYSKNEIGQIIEFHTR